MKYKYYDCAGLTSVTIGEGIREIYSQAFVYCPKITDVYCYAKEVPNTSTDAFKDSYTNATLHVPEESISSYRSTEPWNVFKNIFAIDEVNMCATPTISYENGKLIFDCETDDVKFVSEIKPATIEKISNREILIIPTYEITVYAKKDGYDNSEVATATIRWRDGQPLFEGFESVVLNKQQACDANGDGVVNIADVAAILNAMAGN